MQAYAVVVVACATLVGGGCAPARHAGSLREALGTPGVLFLDLDGVELTFGATDDAITDVSSLAAAQVPAFDAALVAPAVAASDARAVVVDRVRTLYLPFAVEVTTTRPASGDYAMVAVGGASTELSPAAPEDTAGLAALDCTNADLDSVGFAFADELTPQFGGVVVLAATIAHEAGHGYGLEHVLNTLDPMYSVAQPAQTLDDVFALAFGSGDYSAFNAGVGTQPERCGRADPLDDVAILDAALGTQTPSSAAPTVSIEFPPPVATVPEQLTLRASASDDVGVVRVEVYRDLTLVAVLDAPPYEVALTLPASTETRLTVEAVDGEAQRATTHLTFAVAADAPALCDATTPCASGTCVNGSCVVPMDAAQPMDAAMGDAGTPTMKKSGGCAMGGRGGAGGLEMVLVAIALAVARRRQRG